MTLSPLSSFLFAPFYVHVSPSSSLNRLSLTRFRVSPLLTPLQLSPIQLSPHPSSALPSLYLGQDIYSVTVYTPFYLSHASFLSSFPFHPLLFIILSNLNLPKLVLIYQLVFNK